MADNNKIIGVVIFIFLAVAFIGTIANGITNISTIRGVAAESVSGSAANDTSYELDQDEMETFSLYNVNHSAVVDASNYTINLLAGIVTINADNFNETGDVVTANYTYRPDTYVNQAAARNISVAVIGILFVVGIFIGGSLLTKKK